MPIEIDQYKDKYDVLKDIVKVHSKVKKDITADVVLAQFKNEKDRIYVIDMAYCGFYCQMIIDKLLRTYEEYEKMHGIKQGGKIRPINTEITTEINKIKDDVFNLFLNRISVLSLVNRNVANNYIVQGLTTGTNNEEDDTEEGMSETLKKTKDKFKNQERKED